MVLILAVLLFVQIGFRGLHGQSGSQWARRERETIEDELQDDDED